MFSEDMEIEYWTKIRHGFLTFSGHVEMEHWAKMWFFMCAFALTLDLAPFFRIKEAYIFFLRYFFDLFMNFPSLTFDHRFWHSLRKFSGHVAIMMSLIIPFFLAEVWFLIITQGHFS